MRKLDHTVAVSHLKSVDPKLALLMERVGPCELRVRTELDIFQSLLRSIVYQQLAGAAASAILGRVVNCVCQNGDYPNPRQILDAPEETLRAAGLSRNKLLAVKDLAQKAVEGVVPTRAQARRLSDAELIERLITIRGIGVWTVEMLLIFGLGRPDVLPVADYGVRKGFQRTFKTRELPKPKQMLKRGESWRPYRSIASWYLWRASEL
jgi:DNA-3-methyladenine glycosylase II